MNKAYKVLLTPVLRAEYLLRLKDIDVAESNTIANKEFLMEMMERNEAVTFCPLRHTQWPPLPEKPPQLLLVCTAGRRGELKRRTGRTLWQRSSGHRGMRRRARVGLRRSQFTKSQREIYLFTVFIKHREQYKRKG